MTSQPPPTAPRRPPGAAASAPFDLLPRESFQRLARLAALVLGTPVLADVPAADARSSSRSDARPDAPGRPEGEGERPLRLVLLPGHSRPAGALVVSDARAAGRELAHSALPTTLADGVGACVVLPVMRTGPASAGTLCVLADAPRVWSASEVAALEDLAAALADEVELRRGALHDALTGLPNRALFLDRLAHAAERSRRHTAFRFAVLSLDLDRFKVVNNSLGRAAGDEMLVAVARRLEECLRGEDTVARVGGDEFAVLLESLSDDSDSGRVAERIRQALVAPVLVGAEEVFTSASIGVALNPASADSAATLLQSAEIALSRAKAAGRNRYELFDPRMHARAVRRLRAETELRRAVERSEFLAYYQPMVSLSTGRITELEALVRWQHPERGVVPPQEFIPLAEETGLIVPIGDWVLREACHQVRGWQRRLPRERPLGVSVNLSVKQFGKSGFTAQVAAAIAESGLDPRSLKLEITESFAVDGGALTRATLEAVRALGVSIYLDDFGTGYSSLGYLHQLPLDAIKIDRTFVTRMETGPTHLQLVRTVRTLAENIGVAAIAEGVETAEQLATLRALGCEYAQGYLFSKPVPAEEMERLLRADPQW